MGGDWRVTPRYSTLVIAKSIIVGVFRKGTARRRLQSAAGRWRSLHLLGHEFDATLKICKMHQKNHPLRKNQFVRK